VNVLWAAHVVHHQSEEFNLSTALRQTGTSFLFAWIFFLPMAVLGYPPELFLTVSLIDLLYQFWIHTEQIGSLGVIDRILATPSNHRVHHGVNDVYVDRNYGGILMLWDRMFGTFQQELAAVPVVYGSRKALRSWNPLWANLHTYWTLATDSLRAQSWADRLGVWVRHPGWRPADVAARYPDPPVRLQGFKRFDPPLPRILSAYCLLQATVALGVGTRFLAIAAHVAPGLATAYLGWLVLSLWIIGGLCEGRRTFLWPEALRLLALAAGLYASLVPAGPGAAAGWIVGFACAACLSWLWRAGRALPPVPAGFA
jgi:Fatty acid hydroxylase